MILPIKEIVHPTDFSALSEKAFVHALRVALNAHCKLTVIHVSGPERTTERDIVDEEISYLFLDRILSRWRKSKKVNLEFIKATSLGFQVRHIASQRRDVAHTLIDYVSQHNPQLIIIGTHGRTSLIQLQKGSIAETVFRQTAITSMFISPNSRGFVHPVTGAIKLRDVLVPVNHSPASEQAIHVAREFGRVMIGREPNLEFVHIGRVEPSLVDGRFVQPCIVVRGGHHAAKGIIAAATELVPDLICMATAGRHGFLGALRGSTTQRVLRTAPCPVLAIAGKL